MPMTQRKYSMVIRFFPFFFASSQRRSISGQGRFGRRFPLAGKGLFDMGEPVGEFPEGGPEGRFGIDAGKAAEVDHGEDQIPGLLLQSALCFLPQGRP